jgi:arylamine N-acetyltransferase
MFFGDGSLLKAALNNLGFDMEVLAANIYGGDWDEDTVDKVHGSREYSARDRRRRMEP